MVNLYTFSFPPCRRRSITEVWHSAEAYKTGVIGQRDFAVGGWRQKFSEPKVAASQLRLEDAKEVNAKGLALSLSGNRTQVSRAVLQAATRLMTSGNHDH